MIVFRIRFGVVVGAVLLISASPPETENRLNSLCVGNPWVDEDLGTRASDVAISSVVNVLTCLSRRIPFPSIQVIKTSFLDVMSCFRLCHGSFPLPLLFSNNCLLWSKPPSYLAHRPTIPAVLMFCRRCWWVLLPLCANTTRYDTIDPILF